MFALDGNEVWEEEDINGLSIVNLEPRQCPLDEQSYIQFINVIPQISISVKRNEFRNLYCHAIVLARNLISNQIDVA